MEIVKRFSHVQLLNVIISCICTYVYIYIKTKFALIACTYVCTYRAKYFNLRKIFIFYYRLKCVYGQSWVCGLAQYRKAKVFLFLADLNKKKKARLTDNFVLKYSL